MILLSVYERYKKGANKMSDSMKKRYNLAFNYVFDKRASHAKEQIIKGEGPSYDRVWREFIKEVTRLAESDQKIPIVKSNYKELEMQICPSGSQ
jgi:hypothetical protein